MTIYYNKLGNRDRNNSLYLLTRYLMAGNSGNPIDVNLIAGNIKNGVPIYGVLGTFTGTSGNPINSGKIML